MIPNGAKHHKYIHPAKWDEVFVGKYSQNDGSDVKYICYVLFYEIYPIYRDGMKFHIIEIVSLLFSSPRVLSVPAHSLYEFSVVYFFEKIFHY